MVNENLFFEFSLTIIKKWIIILFCMYQQTYKIQATQDEIKTAYKSLSLTFHPDKQENSLKDQSTEIFHMIDDAYTVLSNPDKRKAYDLLGEDV